jgi:DNA-binding NtrC family response regulator
VRAGSRTVHHALVASEDRDLREIVIGVVRSLGLKATEARGSREATLMLTSRPDVFLFGTDLIRAGSLQLIDAANATRPVPLRVAIGSGVAGEDAFELARRGISRLLPRPPTARQIAEAIRGPRMDDPTALLADLVGVVGLAEAQSALREAMTTQALALCGGNRGAAARLLGVSRQALHQSLRRHTESESAFGWERLLRPS